MTDLEITKRCAAAMGWYVGKLACLVVAYPVSDCAIIAGNDKGGESVWDPLHNGGQTFALVERLGLNIGQTTQGVKVFTTPLKGGFHEADDKDLKRAICKCAAKLEAPKVSEPELAVSK